MWIDGTNENSEYPNWMDQQVVQDGDPTKLSKQLIWQGPFHRIFPKFLVEYEKEEKGVGEYHSENQ